MSGLNALSFDLEDWFCVSNMSGMLPTNDWKKFELRLAKPTLTLLDMLDAAGVRATFFVLGWIAEAAPDLVREIALRGHEIASHGYGHDKVNQLSKTEFARDVERSLEVLAKLVKQEVKGYRAPSFSITPESEWAFDVLEDLGFRYDSSIYPTTFHPDYGRDAKQLSAHKVRDRLWEIPLSCVEMFGQRVPCAGGGYFRLYPYALSSYLLKRSQRQNGATVFYLHPWELDPEQPRIALPPLKRFRHYVNLDKTTQRVARLLQEFKFVTVADLIPPQNVIPFPSAAVAEGLA